MALTPFTLPADTQVPFAGDPAGDMNKIVDAILTMGTAGNVLNKANAGGADPSGTNDSTAAFNAALATGTVIIPPGTYKISSSLNSTSPPVVIAGAGKDQVTLKFYGSGDCLRICTTTTLAGFARAILHGFTIDGTHASAGAAGLHMGDVIEADLDIAVNNFQGSGSIGAWFDNQHNYTEKMTGKLYVRANTANVVFDMSANASGSVTNSFDRAILDIFIDSDGVGDGVVFQNGALTFDSRIGIYGNFSYGAAAYSVIRLSQSPVYSFTATHASPCVFTATGSYYTNGFPVTLSGGSLPGGFTATTYYVVSASGDTFELSATSGGSAINSSSTGSGNVTHYQQSSILQSVLNVGVELDPGGPGSTAPYTIYFESTIQKNVILGCTGILDFDAADTFTSTNMTPGYLRSFEFDGPVYGDPWLNRSAGVGQTSFNDGVVGSNATLTSKYAGLVRVTPTGNITGVKLQAFNPDDGRQITILNAGTGSITFAASGTSGVADGTSDVIYPGTAATFYWDTNETLWFRSYPGVSPGQSLCPPSVYAPTASGAAVQLAVSTTTLAAPNCPATTVAAGSNGGTISAIASWSSPSAGVLDVASTAGWPASGTVNVAASGSTTAVVTYTGITSTTLTGCAYVSGSASGTVATGGAVTVTSVALQTNSFIAPLSGAVLVELSMAAEISTGGDKLALALTAAGTVTPVLGTVNTVLIPNTNNPISLNERFYVSGLTAGTSYQLALVGAATSTATATIFAYGGTSTSLGNTGMPVIMTVRAV